jgi:hypothetical protein
MEISRDGVRYGLADQDKRRHGIFEASGVDAHILLAWFIDTQAEWHEVLYATRIDLQRTRIPPESFNYGKAYRSIRKPKQLILGDDGNTLYIGNRESDSYWRIYDKTDSQVRVEVELKGVQAKRVWSSLSNRGDAVSAIYDHYLRRSRVPKMLVDHYLDGRDPLNEDELVKVVPKDLETTYQWLAKLDGLAHKMANDHDYGSRCRALFKRWAEYGRNLDN